MDISRRKFLKSTIGAAGLVLSYGHCLPPAAEASSFAVRRKGLDKILVVIQLAGGNDGMNTVVPYRSATYYQARPSLALKAHELLPLDDNLGLHKSMAPLAGLYQSGKLAIALGVGYPEHNRSHFRSSEIWQTACPEEISDSGWLGRYLELAFPDCAGARNTAPAVNLSATFPTALTLANSIAPRLLPGETKADVGFAARLEAAASMIASGSAARIYTLSLAGFDTHANQKRAHARLLKELSSGLAAFQSDLEARGLDDDVLVLVYSEFGRRVDENNAGGTDHGTAGPLFVLGSAVKGGLYGDYPSLEKLDGGDLRCGIDFRTIYATILDRWLRSDSRPVLSGRFEHLTFLHAMG